MAELTEKQAEAGLSQQAQQALKKVEIGSIKAASQLDKMRRSDPVAVDAAEQEASDGPEGRGLSR